MRIFIFLQKVLTHFAQNKTFKYFYGIDVVKNQCIAFGSIWMLKMWMEWLTLITEL